MKTLEQLFRDAHREGVIDFALRASVTPEGVSFYIHPAQVSGDTLDFRVVDNTLIEGGWATDYPDPR